MSPQESIKSNGILTIANDSGAIIIPLHDFTISITRDPSLGLRSKQDISVTGSWYNPDSPLILDMINVDNPLLHKNEATLEFDTELIENEQHKTIKFEDLILTSTAEEHDPVHGLVAAMTFAATRARPIETPEEDKTPVEIKENPSLPDGIIVRNLPE